MERCCQFESSAVLTCFGLPVANGTVCNNPNATPDDVIIIKIKVFIISIIAGNTA